MEPYNYTLCNWNWNSTVVLSNLSNVVEIWLLTDDRGRSKGFRLTYEMTVLEDEGTSAQMNAERSRWIHMIWVTKWEHLGRNCTSTYMWYTSFIMMFEKNTNLCKWQDGSGMAVRLSNVMMWNLWSLVQFDRCWMIFECQRIQYSPVWNRCEPVCGKYVKTSRICS